MRHIDKKHLPRLVDLTAIKQANRDIQALPAAERDAFINDRDNQKLWSELKEALWNLGNMKCWYSEAELQEGEGHVEHYRPKKKPHGLQGEQHPGYWWRAFDWENYRLSHSTSNLRRKDYLTGKMLGKGSYFPLKKGDTRALSQALENGEHPVLLDPTDSMDCKLISFDTYDGTPIPTFTEEQDSWKHQRAKDSIDYYHLDEGTWNYKRKDLIDSVNKLCEKLLEAETDPNRDQERCDDLTKELISYIDEHKPFTAVCVQTIKEYGLLEMVI